MTYIIVNSWGMANGETYKTKEAAEKAREHANYCAYMGGSNETYHIEVKEEHEAWKETKKKGYGGW